MKNEYASPVMEKIEIELECRILDASGEGMSGVDLGTAVILSD